jgi:hypothetical protein
MHESVYVQREEARFCYHPQKLQFDSDKANEQEKAGNHQKNQV